MMSMRVRQAMLPSFANSPPLRANPPIREREPPVSCAANAARGTMQAIREQECSVIRALFVGGTVDNSELDLDGPEPPRHYPENTGGGQPRYRLHHVGVRDSATVYAVYAAPELATGAVEGTAAERDYARRFDATTVRVDG